MKLLIWQVKYGGKSAIPSTHEQTDAGLGKATKKKGPSSLAKITKGESEEM